MQLDNGLTIESVDPTNISESDLQKIYEIEQDTWAYNLGEYVKCTCCYKIYSKQDIFGHLSKKLKLYTVSKLEDILGISNISCIDCGSDTKHVFGQDYKNEILERYNNSRDSFLILLRGDNGKIHGFTDAYISDFDTIYKREFQSYYGEERLKLVKKVICEKIHSTLPTEFVVYNATCIEGNARNLHNFLSLIYELANCLSNNGYKNLYGLYESTVGTFVYELYKSWGIIDLGVKYDNALSTICLQPNAAISMINHIEPRIFKNI